MTLFVSFLSIQNISAQDSFIQAQGSSSVCIGESELINNCSDGVKCSEAKHQVNRRSEFVIVNIK